VSVYFVQPAGQPVDPIKIGFTDHSSKRFAELERQYGCSMNVLAMCNGGRRLEKTLHSLFETNRVSGEWFEPVDDILRLIEDINLNGADALPVIAEAIETEGIRVALIKDEAAEIVRVLGGRSGSALEQVNIAAAKTGLSHSVIERLRYKKSDRIYADIMDTLRLVLSNEMDAVTAADVFAIKRHLARLRLQPRLGMKIIIKAESEG
jgi:hypothetical protein